MPTAKPRITLTLEEPQYRVLSKLAELQGCSMSSIVVDLVQTVIPVLDRVSSVLQAAKTASESVTNELKKSAESAEAVFSPMAQQLLAELDSMASIAGGAGEVRSASLASPAPISSKKRAALAGPHPTNRGVRIPPPQDKIKGNSPMKKGRKEGSCQK